MEYIVTGVIGAAVGVMAAEMTTPRWRLLPATALLVVLVALVCTAVDVFGDWGGFPPMLVGVIVELVAVNLYTAHIWSRTPMPVDGSYWWWLRESFFRPYALRHIYEAYLNRSAAHPDGPALDAETSERR